MQVSQGRDEVTLEFPVDDTGGDREDALVGMSFHVPRDGTQYAADDDTTSTKVLQQLLCPWLTALLCLLAALI